MAHTGHKPPGEVRPRAADWFKGLAAAGNDMDKARAILNRIRDDKRASKADKEQFLRLLAQQSYVWYLGALRGTPVTPDELRQMARQAAGKPA